MKRQLDTGETLFPFLPRLVDLVRTVGVAGILLKTSFQAQHAHELLERTDRMYFQRNHRLVW